MPIGKNALKRVSNNGCSKVSVSAPDMEHSTVVEPMPEAVESVKTEPVKTASAKVSPKKNTAPKTKKPPVKKPEIKKLDAEAARPDGFVRYEFGAELPTHLL